MKKNIVLMVFGLMILAASAFAVTEDEFAVEPVNPDVQGRGLVDTDVAALSSKVNELERNLNDIERDRRFDQERLRQLDRDVSDLKRRF